MESLKKTIYLEIMIAVFVSYCALMEVRVSIDLAGICGLKPGPSLLTSLQQWCMDWRPKKGSPLHHSLLSRQRSGRSFCLSAEKNNQEAWTTGWWNGGQNLLRGGCHWMNIPALCLWRWEDAGSPHKGNRDEVGWVNRWGKGEGWGEKGGERRGDVGGKRRGDVDGKWQGDGGGERRGDVGGKWRGDVGGTRRGDGGGEQRGTAVIWRGGDGGWWGEGGLSLGCALYSKCDKFPLTSCSSRDWEVSSLLLQASKNSNWVEKERRKSQKRSGIRAPFRNCVLISKNWRSLFCLWNGI